MRYGNGRYEKVRRHHRQLGSFMVVSAGLSDKTIKCSGADLFVDFEKTFIQCIVYNYDVLKEYGNEGDVKAAGKVLTKGKDYVVEDGDIILIKAGAAKS